MNLESDRSPKVTKILKTGKDAGMSGISERGKTETSLTWFCFVPAMPLISAARRGFREAKKQAIN